MDALIYPVAWLLGLMLAPHTLALLGNLAGQLQWMLPMVIAAGVALYWLNTTSLGHLIGTSAEPAHTLDALAGEIGELPADLLFFCGRLITSIAVPTVLLVTAGFVFNETLVYWFPNFAFAFILLGLILSVHLFGDTMARRFQFFCIALALAGIAVLMTMGLVGSPPSVSRGDLAMPGLAGRSFLAVPMLFVGFDLATNHDANPVAKPSRPMMAGLLTAGVTLILWAVVSVLYVPADKLADTYIAHTLTAKAVGGQTGRIVMAVVIIAGTCAAVNALFWHMGRGLARLLSRWRGAPRALQWVRHGTTGSLLTGAIVAAMMATGMAGTDEIDTYVRAGLYLWMLFYAGVHLAVLKRWHREPGVVTAAGFRTSLLGGALMIVISAGLITTDPEWFHILKAAGASLIVMAALSMATRINRRRILVKGNEH